MGDWLNANSGWLSLAALFLAIPLGVFTNLLTPKLQEWWSLRSKNAVRQRIAKLEQLVEQTDRFLHEPSYAIAKFTFWTMQAILALTGSLIILGLLGTAVVLFVLIYVMFYISSFSSNQEVGQQILSRLAPLNYVVGAIIVLVIAYLCARPYFEVLRFHNRVTQYEAWKEETLKEIETLKGKLTLRERTTSDGLHAGKK